MSRRLFAASLDESRVQLDDDARQHTKVLRLRDGAQVELFDGRGGLARGVLEGKAVAVESLERHDAPMPALALLVGQPKPKTCDAVVRFATELGAARIDFVRTEHTDDKRAKAPLARWRKIAIEASRQCERLHLPTLNFFPSVDDALVAFDSTDRWSNATRYVCWARGDERNAVGGSARIVAVGPEGGFADDELERLRDAQFQEFRLARHVLRVDTAVCAALAMLAP